MSGRRVAITGVGALTPIGNTAEEFWSGLVQGRSGIGPITRFDASAFPTRIARDITAALWGKLLVNSMTVLGAVGGCLTGELLAWAYGGPVPRGLEALAQHVHDVPEAKLQLAAR